MTGKQKDFSAKELNSMNRLDVATSKQAATVPSPASSTKARSHNSVFRWLTSFWNGLFGSKSPPHPQSLVDKSPVLLQAFILEPMYTPSGLVDGIDDTPDLATMDIDTPELPELGEDWDISDGESQTSSNMDGDVDVTLEDTADSSAETTPETPLLTDQLEDIPFINPTFESGTFTVGETGEVSIDFLFDGGGYQGELAIFSLDGMDEFEPGSEEFIQEAASRALSDSELGHVVISDQTEGAKFFGELGERDQNSGDYLGVKTVEMRPGDEFGFMLIPNGRVQQVFDNPDAGGAIRPLFSMATANPEDAFHSGQIADVTGDGSTFVMEDLRVDTKSDGDYNDVIFQVRGATGEAALMDEVIESGKDWRETDLGQALIDYAEPYITPDTPDDGGLLTDELVGESLTDDIPVDESEIVTEPTTDESTDVVIDEPVNNSEIVTEPTTDESTDVVIDEPVNNSEIVTEPTTDPELAEPVQNEFSQENQPLVGIIDTGFSDNNPDIDYSRISLGQDRIDGDDNPLMEAGEGNEHGTHILGTIGATQDNDIGIDGINDDAPIWVGRAVGSGQWAESLVEFVDAAQESGQPNAVVNLSMDLTQIDADGNVTTRYEFTPQERSAIEYARQNNVMLVVAAGNDGGVMSALGQASQEFDNIITVGAAEQFDPNTSVWKGFERSDYSSYGNGLDIMANGGTIDHPTLSLTDEGVGTMAGTSVATANVTGAASQIWAANPELSYRQVIEILKDTATDLGTPNWNSETGTGLLNMAAAVNLAKATQPETHYAPSSVIPESWSGEGQFTPGERAVSTPFMGKYYDWVPYTIQSGDTLSEIALRTMGNGSATYYNFIAQHNGIANPNFISTGSTIQIPQEVSAPAPPPSENPGDNSNSVPNPLLGRQGVDYFKARPQYYISGNIFSLSNYGSHLVDGRSRTEGNCTWYAHGRLLELGGNRAALQSMNGNANEWHYQISNGSQIVSSPQPGDIAQWTSNGANHVAVVEQVNSDGTIVISESHYNTNWDGGGAGTLHHVRTISASNPDRFIRVPGVQVGGGQSNSGAANETFTGRIIATIGANVRSGPSTGNAIVGTRNYGALVTFDEVKTGEFVSFPSLGTATDKWYRIAGTNEWISGAIVSGSPENSLNAPPARPGERQQYIIKSGDTLWGIAQQYLHNGSRWREITKADGSTFTDAEARRLQVGMSVYLPVGYQTDSGKPVSPPPTPKPKPVQPPSGKPYKIKAGDTLWGIAQRYLGNGSRWREIKKPNGSSFTDAEARKLRIGQIIYLPDGSKPTQPKPPSNPSPSSWQNPLDSGTYTVFPGGEFGARGGSHYGIDLSTWHSNPYVPVKAAKPGKVVEIGNHPNGWGNFVRINHGNEFQTIYAHLSRIDVSTNQIVAGGQQIGKVGSTGNSSGPHLHFETRVSPFRWKTDNRNPRNYINF